MRLLLDIDLFCRTYGLEYAAAGQHHHGHEGWVQLHCPFCAGGASGFHLGFSLERGNFNCWRCGSHSTWETVGAFIGSGRKDEISRAISKCAKQGQEVRKQAAKARKRRLAPPPASGPLRKRHRQYLRTRRFDPIALAEEWGLLGTLHLSGSWSYRIVAPIRDKGGRTVAYVGRHIGNKTPKYKVTDNDDCLVDPKSLVYGIDKVPGDSVVVVEGPADVWRLGPGAVALLGVDWKRAQANQLRKFKRVFILFDSVKKDGSGEDKLAKRRAQKLADYLALFCEVEIISGFKTDPGDFTDKKARRVMRELLGVL